MFSQPSPLSSRQASVEGLVKTRNLVEEAYLGSLQYPNRVDVHKKFVNYIELVSVDSA